MRLFIQAMLILIIVMLMVGCSNGANPALPESITTNNLAPSNSAATPTSKPPTIASTTTETATIAPTATAVPKTTQILSPLLSDALTHNCENDPGPKADGPREGDLAIEFTLQDVDGNKYTLSELLSEKPVYMIFGSFT